MSPRYLSDQAGGSQPWFHEQYAAVFSQHSLHLRKCFFQIVGKRRQMVQTALDDQNVLAASREGKLAAVTNETFCRAPILRDQSGRQVHSREARESEAFQRVQPIAAPAKEFHDFGIARPLSCTQFA